MSGIRVAMLAPPWLPIPPEGYGGIENVLYALVPELMKLGVHVELFTIGETTLKAHKNHSLYAEKQYHHIHKPQYEALPITAAHLLFALNKIKKSGQFDIIHDHNGFLGPLVLASTDRELPPAIHTLHGPPFTLPGQKNSHIPDNIPMWRQFATAKGLYFVAISQAMIRQAPRALRPLMLPVVHNALPIEQYPYRSKKDDYFITLARFNADKGHHIAIRACQKLGYRLKMAGIVGDLKTPKKLMMELANPLSLYRSLSDFRYYSDKIFPHLEEGQIEYVGEVSGERKLRFISRARALLFPIQWEEPFGMAVIESLACGTPVVAMKRGAMPEIIEHGVNGFLAKNKAEFIRYMKRIDEIEPEACRKSVERRFSGEIMAKRYIERYEEAIARVRPRKARRQQR